MKIDSIILNNNLQVLFIDFGYFPTFTSLFLIKAGSKYESKNNNGIAHFLEHMVFKGTKNFPTAKDISISLENIGSEYNAFTGKEYTAFYINSTISNFESAFKILSDLIINPLIPENEIEKEKSVIIEEINMYEDKPVHMVGELFENLIFRGNSIAMDIIGTKENVQNFKKDVFVDFYSKYYLPENSVLVLAGGFSSFKNDYLNYFGEIISKYVNNWNSKNLVNKDIVYKSKNQNSFEINIKTKKTEQTNFCLGFKAFSYFDKNRYALEVLSAILGDGMASKLFSEVREKRGLCYYISTDTSMYSTDGYIVTQTGISNDISKLEESIEIILQQHYDISSGNVTDEEIFRAKEFIKGNFLLSLENSKNIANFFAFNKLLKNEINKPENIVEKIDSVTKQDIIDLSKQLFTKNNLNFSLIGPHSVETVENILKKYS